MATTPHGQIRVTVKIHGQQYERHFPPGTSQKVQADWKARERIRRLDDRPAADPGTLAGDVEHRYLPTLQHRPRLKAERTLHLDWWVARFGARPRPTLIASELATALSELRLTKAASTCNHYRTALFHLYTTLDGKDAPNPLKDVPPFEGPEAEPREIPYPLIDRILAQLTRQWGPKDAKRPQKTKARLRVIADTGLTPAQMMRLRPGDLHLEDAAVFIRRRLKGKGSKGTLKPLSWKGVDALRQFVAAEAFGPWSVQSANKAWRRACDQAMALPETTAEEAALLLTARLYDLRHSFGTLVFALTGSLAITGELLDHRSTKTTRRYALGAIPAHLKAAVASLNGWHSQPPHLQLVPKTAS